jgi:acetyl esterase/lipase
MTSSTDGDTIHIVASPQQGHVTFALTGRMVNPHAESWVSFRDGLPLAGQTGVASLGRPEMWVWNVSEPSLQPFLPNRTTATGAAMIVIPGGAFMGLAIDREGFSVAQWLSQQGIAAFVLKYRLAPMPADPAKIIQHYNERMQQLVAGDKALSLINRLPSGLTEALLAAREDGLEAVRYVRTRAEQWQLAHNRIGVLGFSAGAVLAGDIAMTADASSRPDAAALIYGGLSEKPSHHLTPPPAFLAVATDDGVASSTIDAYNTWRSLGGAADLHVFEEGGHGFAMIRQGKLTDQWQSLFGRWLRAHQFQRG